MDKKKKERKRIDLGTRSQDSRTKKKSIRELVAKKLDQEPRVRNQKKKSS